MALREPDRKLEKKNGRKKRNISELSKTKSVERPLEKRCKVQTVNQEDLIEIREQEAPTPKNTSKSKQSTGRRQLQIPQSLSKDTLQLLTTLKENKQLPEIEEENNSHGLTLREKHRELLEGKTLVIPAKYKSLLKLQANLDSTINFLKSRYTSRGESEASAV